MNWYRIRIISSYLIRSNHHNSCSQCLNRSMDQYKYNQCTKNQTTICILQTQFYIYPRIGKWSMEWIWLQPITIPCKRKNTIWIRLPILPPLQRDPKHLLVRKCYNHMIWSTSSTKSTLHRNNLDRKVDNQLYYIRRFKCYCNRNHHLWGKIGRIMSLFHHDQSQYVEDGTFDE